MGEIGEVIAVEGGFAVLRMERKEACAKCNACAAFGGQFVQTRAVNACNADVGDFAEVELPDGAFIKAAGYVYGGMLAALFAVGGAAYGVAAFFGVPAEIGEVAAVVGGVFGVWLFRFVLNRLDKRFDKRVASPVLVRKIDKENRIDNRRERQLVSVDKMV